VKNSTKSTAARGGAHAIEKLDILQRRLNQLMVQVTTIDSSLEVDADLHNVKQTTESTARELHEMFTSVISLWSYRKDTAGRSPGFVERMVGRTLDLVRAISESVATRRSNRVSKRYGASLMVTPASSVQANLDELHKSLVLLRSRAENVIREIGGEQIR